MSYTHLSASERFKLYELREKKHQSLRMIAKTLNRSKSTISRELKRNNAKAGLYLPDRAHLKMRSRCQRSKHKFMGITPETLSEIKARLQQYHSPEQIAGQMKRQGLKGVSYETIYQMIYTNYHGLGEYRRYLRQARKQRRRKGTTQKRGGIPGRVGIEHRPMIADTKTEIGHWEGDTVIGGHHAGALVTHVDKTSKFLLVALVKQKSVDLVNQATLKLFQTIPAQFRKTLTFDNGKEFCGHQTLADTLGVSCFFARPYHSWERGLNEHTNGLLRQFFPKGTNFNIVHPEHLQKVADLINHRPRKSLDFLTPYQVLFPQLSDPGALQS
jgi:transposase, IS30 family